MTGHIIQLSRGDIDVSELITVRKVAGTKQMLAIGAEVAENPQGNSVVLLDLLVRFKGIEVREVEDSYAVVVTNKRHYFGEVWDLVKGDFAELSKMNFSDFCRDTYSTIVKNLCDRYTNSYDLYVWTEDMFCPLDDFIRKAETGLPYFVYRTLAYFRK